MSASPPGDARHDRDARIPRASAVQIHEVPETGESVLQDLERGTILVVNPIGSAIFTLIDGSRNVAEIVEFVAATLEVPRASVAGDVDTFLEQLASAGMITWSGP